MDRIIARGPTGEASPVLTLSALALVVVGCLTGLATGSLLPAAGAIGAVVLLMCARSPRFAAVLVMFLWAGPFATQAASRRVAGIPLDAADVVVVAAFAGHIVRCLRDRRPLWAADARRVFVWPILLYLVVVVVGTVRGVAAGNALGTASDALFAMSALAAYLLFRVAYAGRIRTFAGDLTVVAVIGCALLVVAALAGFAPSLGVVVGHYDTRGVQDTQLRIDAPVNRLAIPAILLVVLGAVPYRPSGRWWKASLLLAPMVAALGMSMTRSTWLPVIAAVIALPAMTGRWRRSPVTLFRRAVIACAVIVLAVGAATSGLAGEYTKGVAVRFLSAGDSDVLQDDSYQQRLVENEKAFLRISEEPVLGVGFPRAYGAFVSYFPENLGIQVSLPRYFIHNSYLGVLMWFGIPGLVALLGLGVAALTLFKAGVKTMPGRRAVPLAVIGTFAIFALTSTFQTQLTYEPFYLVMALVMALADVWLDREAHLARAAPEFREVLERPAPRVRRPLKSGRE